MAPWESTTEKIYSRPIGENEVFIKMVGDPGHAIGREHWAINSIASIETKGTLVETITSQLRCAWAHLRFQHPSLAAYPDGENLVYKVPTPEELRKWIESTFRVVYDAQSAAELIRTFKPEASATLTFVPKTGELLGHTAHWRTDGIGVLLLLDALLKLVIEPDLGDPAALPWGEEASRLAPSVEDAANVPAEADKEQKALGQACVDTFALAGGAVGIPFLPQSIPRGTVSATAILSATDTKLVVEAAKKKNISVTSAVHASVAVANWNLADNDRKNQHYTSTVRFSLRPYLPEPFSTPAYASGLYTTGWMEKVEPTKSWKEIAAYFHDFYKRGISTKFLEAHREYAKGLGDMLRSLPPDLSPASDVDISSIGVAENLIGQEYGSDERGIVVKTVSVGVEILTPQAVCFVWTFRNQLNFNVVYNEAFHEDEQMQKFVETVKSVLLSQLAVEEDN